jgi:hypothetical protein
MVKLGEIIIGFEVGLIIDILIEESLKGALKFSFFFGVLLGACFLIYKIANHFSWIEIIENGLESIQNILDGITDFFENAWEWIKSGFEY